MMNAPRFWQDNNSVQALLLRPLSWLWLAATNLRRQWAKPYRSSLPVVCIGNITAGGTGKTPAAIALLGALGAKNPVFLTRGYGGRVRKATLAKTPSAAAHGDEAVLLARHAPVIIARDRVEGLKLAEFSGFDCVIADDGFQNPHFEKTASVLVFDGETGIGNGLCIPAGPLRERLSDALPRADAILMVGDDATDLTRKLGGKTVFKAQLKPAAPAPNGSYVAFAGIGRPQKFFSTLAQAGYAVVETVSFPDHHPYSASDIERLQSLAARHKARLVTTEKDLARLPDDVRAQVDALPVAMDIENIAALAALLKARA